MPQLVEAQVSDASLIASLLKKMSEETEEFGSLGMEDLEKIIHRAIEDHTNGTTWFYFQEKNEKFGCCYLQNVHIYWRSELCHYLGGFYIQPELRGRGYFHEMNRQLNEWMDAKGTGEVFIMIHEENEKSVQSFKKEGYERVFYNTYIRGWEGRSDS